MTAAPAPVPRHGLRLQINLIVGALTLAFVAALLTVQLRGMRDSVQEETIAANRVAAQLLNRTAWQVAAQGPPALLSYLQQLGRVRSNEITLTDDAGTRLYESPPSSYKAGRDAPDWFAALVLPTQPVQSFAFPGGRLEVRANASRAVLDAWDAFVPLAAGGATLLLLVNGLVFWAVGRTVRPFGRIVAALDTLQAGRFDVALPPLPGREAAAIGTAFNRMVGELQRHIETERRAARAEEQLSESRELARWIDHHVEQERRAIARELHDELGQSVTAIRSLALSVAQRTRDGDPVSAQAATLIADESSRLYDAMHGLIPRLAPLVLDSFGLAEALADLAERTRRSQPGLALTLRTSLDGVALRPEAALALYRAAQEGLTNALRHGRARQVRIELAVEAAGPDAAGPPAVALRVEDDGVGLAPASTADGPARGEHHGLRWLGERVAALRGRFRLEPGAVRGAVLQVWLPLEAAA
ncbi:histidine kinase [Piscinibacter sakaiensis]|uniref:histidine kinase n=1 Tax=Piscinibacter sakaiensis TaxID=1547922 RepID=UPI001E368BF1|nr:histidine kinase [Piscinibacter sakaiensis]